ncbi:hypothetical protein IBTHAUMO2_390010 [Nitrosopumilaceae archaeon]|nr:hypothetical protein IBTHAUMO2_390010 [Nitrosopumilaceae archaeon]
MIYLFGCHGVQIRHTEVPNLIRRIYPPRPHCPLLGAVIADQFISEAGSVRCGNGHGPDSALGIWQDGTLGIIKIV